MLKIVCPHCEHESDDSFEMLDADCVEQIRCEGCEAQYWLAIMECHACAHEEVFSWSALPVAASLALLRCTCCTKTFRREDVASPAALE